MTSKGTFEQADSHVLSDLGQIKILADPLRVRILELLCRDEMTTKQVAESLGEKPTKLYHHVEALERAGLVHLVRTQPNRGTLEKYYRSVARAFTVDAGLFSSEGVAGAGSPLTGMVGSVIDRTREELGALMASESSGEIESAGLISFLEIEASEAELEGLRNGLEELIGSTASFEDEATAGGERRRYRLTLAFYPLDRS